MNGAHWTEQDFIRHAYGVGPMDDHLNACAECRDRWTQLESVRRAIVHEPVVPNEILAEQRRRIYQRIGREPRAATRVTPAFAVVLLMVIGIFLIRRSDSVPPAPATSVSDAQLFSEIYALEQTSEPHIATPMRSLFEEN